MTRKLTRDDLFSLEEYASKRGEFRSKVMAHKKHRTVHLGDHATLYFEDRLTVRYQIQEMLRVEKIFEPEAIQDELDAYNPLIPDGRNLKATFMIEYPDVEERKRQLASLVGIEDKVWLRIDGFETVYPIADEDLERDTGDKTSSVHFLRFEFTEDMCRAAKEGAALSAGVEHPHYTAVRDPMPDEVQKSLVADFE